jgi:hypothetical protein
MSIHRFLAWIRAKRRSPSEPRLKRVAALRVRRLGSLLSLGWDALCASLELNRKLPFAQSD